MVNFDFTPFYRSVIGFDRMAQFLENAQYVKDVENGYPPYNIEVLGEDGYRITLAVAGFAEADLDVTVEDGNLLVVSGRARPDGIEFDGWHVVPPRNIHTHYRV